MLDLLPIAVSFCDFFLVSSSEKDLNCNLVHCEVCLEEGHLLLREETQQWQDNSVSVGVVIWVGSRRVGFVLCCFSARVFEIR